MPVNLTPPRLRRGFKFRRQHPVRGFILDFYCPEKKLAIEVDGEIHDNRRREDIKRQTILECLGISFLRFRNSNVFNDIDLVLKTIKRKLVSSNLHLKKDEVSPLHKVERGRKG